jgi:DNA polymerase-3 subunit delta
VAEPELRLVVGDDDFLAERAIAATVEAARAADPATIVADHAAQEMSVGDLVAAVSPALFGGPRVVVIRGGQDARKDLAEAILSYVATPEPDVTLVVTHAGGAKGKALADGLRKAGAAVADVPKPRYEKVSAFVQDEFRSLGHRVAGDVAALLVEAVGSGTRELAAACHQLVADTGGRVGLADVKRYYRGRAEVGGYEISDAVMAGNLAGALEALRWALHTGVDPVPIADALAAGVRNVARVASAGRGDPKAVAGVVGMHWFQVKKVQAWVPNWPPEAIVAAMRIVGTCNVDVRGGVEDRAYALESAVTRLVGLRGAGAQRR